MNMIYDLEGGGRAAARQGEEVKFDGRGDRIGFYVFRSRSDRSHSAAYLVALPCAHSRALHATSRSAGWLPSGPGARTSLTGGLSDGSSLSVGSSLRPYPIVYSLGHIVYDTSLRISSSGDRIAGSGQCSSQA